jgi:hypothetical protein
MKDRRRGLDPAEFLVRMGRVRVVLVLALAGLALFGAYSLG